MQQTPSFLDEDSVTISGQRFALISVVSSNTNQKSDTLPDGKLALKIRGVFDTKDEADNHAKKLQKLDPHFDIFLTEVGKWLLLPPELEKIDDIRYQEPYLNELIKGHRESQILAKQLFEQRKTAIMEKGLDSVLLEEEKANQNGPSLPEPVEWIPTTSENKPQ